MLPDYIILSDYSALDALYNWIIENMSIADSTYTRQSEYFKIVDAKNFSVSIHYSGYIGNRMRTIYINDNGNITRFSVKE